MYKVVAIMKDNLNIERYSNIEHFNEYKEKDAIRNFNKQFKKIKMLSKNLFNLLSETDIQFNITIKLYENDNLIKEYNGIFYRYMFNKKERNETKWTMHELNQEFII